MNNLQNSELTADVRAGESRARFRIDAQDLYHACDTAGLGFETTAELEALAVPLGQERANEAAHLAIAMPHGGYNLIVIGPSGIGKHAFVRSLLERAAQSSEVPSDWCYVHNFERPHQPRALQLPPGRARELAADMTRLVDELHAVIPAAFESDDSRRRLQQIEDEFKSRPENVFHRLNEEAKRHDMALIKLPNGVAFAATRGGNVLSADEFEKLSEAEQNRFKEASTALQQQLQRELGQLPQWAREARQKARDLSRDVTRQAVEQAVDDLRARYAELPKVVEYLHSVRDDVIEHSSEFRRENDEDVPPWLQEADSDRGLRRYRVNVLVDHSKSHGAPILYEDRPACDRLLGRIEQRAILGNLVSDFTLIKPGALHLANHGYLIIDAHRLLGLPNAWDSLKRALTSREVRIESLVELLGLSHTATLEPEPIPLELKVVLIADRTLYHLLTEVDPDVGELFKVVADFEEDVDRNAETERAFARTCATLAAGEKLRPLSAAGVARTIEQSSRMAGDSRKLSLYTRALADLLREANHIASNQGNELIDGNAVEAAIESEHARLDRLRQRFNEQILKNDLLIDTSGEKIGQVNGLSIIEFGGHRFAIPIRITATVRVGEGKVIDIEREVALGGPLHSKGVLILSAYFASRYSREFPLSLSASLVFEQSYASVEGDSASLAELCALLAALSGLPIRQSIALTGSVDQLGLVQTIGGVNEKIEGFFDVCKARGLTGEQGVIIPKTNVPHLMLRSDVVEAVRSGLFAIYAVECADQAIELLTGQPAGECNEQGEFPEGSVNQRVLAQLVEFAIIAQTFDKLIKVESPEGAASDSARVKVIAGIERRNRAGAARSRP